MKNKSFIAVISVAFVALCLSFTLPENNTKKIGIQIYTLKDSCKANLKGTLKKVSDIGYNEIEIYGYAEGKVIGLNPSDFKTLANSLNLTIISAHIGINSGNYTEIIEVSKQLGLNYIVIPYIPKEKWNTMDSLKAFANELNFLSKKVREAGMTLGYHNHNFEFETVDNITVLDYLIENTDSGMVTFEADLYWFVKAGKDPIDYFKKYPGRFELIHIKDMAKQKNYLEEKANISTVLGTGQINFKKIMAHSKTAGMKHYFLEQERFNNALPFDAVQKGYNYLKKADF